MRGKEYFVVEWQRSRSSEEMSFVLDFFFIMLLIYRTEEILQRPEVGDMVRNAKETPW